MKKYKISDIKILYFKSGYPADTPQFELVLKTVTCKMNSTILMISFISAEQHIHIRMVSICMEMSESCGCCKVL